MTDFINRALFSVASAPGTGNISVGAAVSGPYRTLGAAHDGKTFDIAITDGNAWEVRTGCTYTHGTTTLTRGTLEDSSTGSAISLSASAQVMVTAVSSRETFVERLMRGTQPGGRLTLTSGTPVTASDVTGATTLYYTPYVHDTIVLWDGARWRPVTFAETSLALGTMTANANYDVFGYLSGGALALEKLVWTSDTARATAVTIQDGRYCKSGDKTRLYLGTFRSTSTTATEDSVQRRLLWNTYNRTERPVAVATTSSSWSYASAAWRAADNSNGNRAEVVCGLQISLIRIVLQVVMQPGSNGGAAQVGVGEDTAASVDAAFVGRYAAFNANALNIIVIGGGVLSKIVPLGYHFYQWVESAESGTTSFFGLSSATPPRYVSGFSGSVQS